MTTQAHAAVTGFRLWLGAATVSTLGDSITYFALAWAASGISASAASWVLTAGSIPLVVLMLPGGVIADRYGIRRTMIVCDAAMVLVMCAVAVAAMYGTPLWLLISVEAVSGCAAALRRPADGVFPRMFSDGEDLAKRMATVGGANQIARVVGPAAAGVLVATGGLPVTAGIDALTFAAVLVALIVVRPPAEAAPDPGERSRSRSRQSLVEGLSAARTAPGVPAMIVAVAALAAAVLPLVSLCLPLLARERGWTAGQTGVVSAAWIAGGLIMTAIVAKRGAPGNRVAVAGPLLAVGGVALLGATTLPTVGFLAMAVVGLGTTMLTSHLFPAFVNATPAGMLARFWSLVQLAQTLPTSVFLPLLGFLAASAGGLALALTVVAVLLLITAVAARRVIRLLPTPDPAPS
jgi:hypothetical protein